MSIKSKSPFFSEV